MKKELEKNMKILGLHGGHDSAYAILEDGIPKVHNELERFNRQKGCKGDSLKLFLEQESDKDFEYIVTNRTGKFKQYFNYTKDKFLSEFPSTKLFITNHHQAHAANTFYTSPYEKALIITIDGGGVDYKDGRENSWGDLDSFPTQEGVVTATTIWDGNDNKITPIKMFDRGEINIGLYWDVCTYNIFGLNRNPVKRGEEGTVMGMAALGNPNKYIKHFVNLGNPRMAKEWGPLDMDFLRGEAEKSEQNKFDIAASLQQETEKVVKNLLKPFIDKYKPKNICLSGGVSLNCVLVGKMFDWYPGVNIFCDPIPYDAGLTIGGCRYVWHHILDNPRIYDNPKNTTSYLGITYGKDSVLSELDETSVPIEYKKVDDDYVVDLLLKDDNVISVYGGGSESGRRALGNRSILADPRSPNMKDIINEKVKHRQWFRPFAPSILREEVKNWFKHDVGSPYMSIALHFKDGMEKKVPAVCHFDNTARFQTVTEKGNEWYYNFIKKFGEKTGVPIVLNTSFNDREPIVETPEHAINCFLRTSIDYLYFRDYNILVKKA
jgi:carbamoyltransferase